jgi:peptidoglycan/LPS O-acetylase OafA/YrhL
MVDTTLYKPKLDSLRCLAVLCVLPVHFLTPNELPLLAIVDLGNIGVQMFFVLSGYLICQTLLSARDRLDAGVLTFYPICKEFFVRRIIRLSPVYFLYLIASYFLLPGLQSYIGWFLIYAQNFLFALNPSLFAKYLAHFWTLAIEEQFYLLLPFLILKLNKKYLIFIPIVLIFIAVAFRLVGISLGYGEFQLRMMLPSHCDTLGAGVLLAILRWQKCTLSVNKLLKFGLLLGLPSVLALGFLNYLKEFRELVFVLENVTLSAFFVSLIGYASAEDPKKCLKILDNKGLIFIGRISYGIYVYHFNVPGLLRTKIYPMLGLALPEDSSLRFIIFTLISIAISAFSYYTLETFVKKAYAKHQG